MLQESIIKANIVMSKVGGVTLWQISPQAVIWLADQTVECTESPRPGLFSIALARWMTTLDKLNC